MKQLLKAVAKKAQKPKKIAEVSVGFELMTTVLYQLSYESLGVVGTACIFCENRNVNWRLIWI